MKNKAFFASLLLIYAAQCSYAEDRMCRAVLSTPEPQEQEQAATGDPEKIQIETDSAELDREGNARLKDGVVRQGDRRIAADEVEYRAKDNSFRVQGKVDYSDPQIRVRGDAGSYDAISGARIKEAQFELPSRPARGGAEEITVTPKGRITLKKVQYTTCPSDAQDWVLTATDITLDTETREGTGRGVRLDFKGVPILYTPIISFPLGDERKSGFLFPDLGHSNRSGAELSVPYYFNLAPNYDLTLTPRFLSRRGFGLDPEFRYLTESHRGTVWAQYLPHDQLRNSDRGLIEWEHRSDFADFWRLTVDAANASDENYFEDFGLGYEGTSVTYLERNAELNYYGRNWMLLAQVQNFQTIDQTISDPARPYSRLPRVVGRGEWDKALLGLDYRMYSELVYFYRNAIDGDLTGTRLDVEPEISWSFTRPGLYVTPAVAYRQTQYGLRNAPGGTSDSPNRGAPMASFDAGMVFERSHGRRDQRVQTLEPRLLYLYVPYRDQSDLPVFDTDLPDLNLVQLFRRNRYVGADRLSDANQVSFGVTSRLLDAQDGDQFLSATVGQTYYFDTPRVTLPGESPAIRNTSNFISQVALTAYRNWNVNFGHEWNPQISGSEKTELALQYRPAGDRVVNAGYRFRRNLIEQVDTSVAWPISGRWNVFARAVYSLRESALIDQFAGFEYSSCCWRLRLVQRRYVSDRTGERDSSIALQLELGGLSSVGVSADAFLERSIRGYSRESVQ